MEKKIGGDRMKKMLVLVGLLGLISLASAAGLTVSVSDTTGAPGDTAEVPINLKGATEIGSMDIVLNYDANVIGDAGATSYLTLEEVLVHNLDLGEIIPNLNLNKLKTENILWQKEEE
jgi:hypothetical protein